MKMTTMKLMMMMTLSEEVDEVSFDPTASGRLFSAVQNIIGRSDLSTSTTISWKLACPKEEEEERQGGDHPSQEKVEPGGEAGEIDGDVGEMVVDVIGGEIDRISDDVGEMLVDQRDFLLICPKMSFFWSI